MEKWLKWNIKTDTSSLTSKIRISQTDTSSLTSNKIKNEFLPANNNKKNISTIQNI